MAAVGGLAVGSLLAGCSGGGETGMLSTSVSDQPGDIGDFDSLLIQIDGVHVKPEDGDIQQMDADAEVDLTELVGEASALVNESEVETGS